MAYHPDCKSCKEFKDDYERLASRLKEKKSNIEVSAINFSQYETEKLDIEAYPTFRLYTAKNKFSEFEKEKLNLVNVKKWLKQNGGEW